MKTLIALLLLTALSWAQPYSVGTIQDRDGWTHLREKPDLKSQSLDKVYQGDRFLIVRRQGDFFDVLLLKVDPDQPDVFGYLHSSRVKVVHTAALGAACINDPDGWVNLRSGPSSQHKILGRIDKTDGFFVLTQGEWCKVMTRQGLTGFVHKSRIEWLLPRN